MRYIIGDNKEQLIHVSSGQLINESNFIHPRRKLDTWVIIVCTKGNLFITQDNRSYTLTENQYIILFADHEHFGFKESEGNLSYYWCHFWITGEHKTVNYDQLIQVMNTKKNYQSYYIVPEYGDISNNGRAIVIFRQLLDLSRKDCYSDMLPNYALSFLAMEISQEFVESFFSKNNIGLKPKMEKIIEWTRVNFKRQYSLEDLAKIFDYNSDYLSTAFRRYTGIPLMKYIRIERISNAKKLLLTTNDGIKKIAWQIGYEDEKLFMKQFRELEGVSPTKYRNAFNRSKIVRE